MRVLVTGGTGYLGSAVVRALARRGHETVVFARAASSSPVSPPSGPAPEPFDGDVRDLAALRRAARGCAALCHTAALVSLWRRRPLDFDEVNVGGLDHVLRVASEARARRVVYTSSFLALPPSGTSVPQRWNDYQRTKVAADALASRAAAAGAPVVRLYPGVIYGPGPATEGNLVGRQIADHLRGRLPGIVGADRRWSFAWVDDVAEAHVAALEWGEPGARYELGGENERQMRVFEIVRSVTGRRLPKRIPGPVASGVAALAEMVAAVSGRPPLLTTGTVEILQRDWPLASDAAAEALGYRVTPLVTGVRRLVEALSSGGGETAAGAPAARPA